MSSLALRKRIAALEKAHSGPSDYAVTIRGGLPGPLVPQAVAGALQWRGADGEDDTAFRRRVWREARVQGLKTVVFGGLPLVSQK